MNSNLKTRKAKAGLLLIASPRFKTLGEGLRRGTYAERKDADVKKILATMEFLDVVFPGIVYDKEEAVEAMDRLDQVELPVVDEKDRLVGTVTADDAMDVMQAEATEDMERMAAMAPSERPYLRTRVWDLYRSRIFWLLLLMLSATFTGAIITHFENALAAQVVLTAFIPMLMDTGGNCGSQSSVTVIRGLSLGEIKSGDWLRVMGKELQVGLLCGGTLAAVNMARLCLLGSTDFYVALAVSLTLIVTVTCAKLLGCCLPILASRLKLDPAVMASPLITTIADAVSLFVYFRIAVCLLKL